MGYKLEYRAKATETFILNKKVVLRHGSPIDPTLLVIGYLIVRTISWYTFFTIFPIEQQHITRYKCRY